MRVDQVFAVLCVCVCVRACVCVGGNQLSIFRSDLLQTYPLVKYAAFTDLPKIGRHGPPRTPVPAKNRNNEQRAAITWEFHPE